VPPGPDDQNSLDSSAFGLVDVRVILEVIPYTVALWSLDRRSCIFNHPTRELLRFSDDDFNQNSSLWMDRIHLQERDAFVSPWSNLQAGDKKIACRYRFLAKNHATALLLTEISIVQSRRESDVL